MRFTLFTLAVFSILVMAGPARADYFVWADPESGISLSYPDTWKRLNNQQPDDVFTVGVPSGEDQASCRIRSDKDGRFKIYPSQFYDEIQAVAYSKSYWDEYNALYDNVTVHTFREVAGLGKGFGSMEVISYDTAPGTPHQRRTGILFVSFYDNHAYVAECSSRADAYAKYHAGFLGFVKSVDFEKTVHELTIGNYRDFLKDWGELEVVLPNAISVTVF